MSLQQLDQFNYHHHLAAYKGLALTLFTSESCSACKVLARAMLEFQHQYPEIGIYEIDAQMNPALVHELEFFHLPALYLYKDGEFHSELQPLATALSIKNSIDKALMQPAQEAP